MIIRGARSKAARTTLLSASHSRFYSRPSKPANAPAFAAHHAHQDLSLPFFNTSPSSSSTTSAEMASFLTREGPYSVLPPPLPTAQPSAATPSATTPEPETWYTDTQTQDLLAVINACLHNLLNGKPALDQSCKQHARLRRQIGVHRRLAIWVEPADAYERRSRDIRSSGHT